MTAHDAESPTPFPNNPVPLSRGTLMAVCLAICVAQIGIPLASPLIGEIQRDLGASATALAWIPAAFILPTAILELNFGVLGDLFGRKRLLVLGGLLITAGCLVVATATSMTQLIAGQVIAGLGAAAIFPTSLAVIVAGTREAVGRARALSYWALSLAFGAMIAPLISGFIAEHAHWGWAFVPLAVLGLVTAAVSRRWLVDSPRATAGRGLDGPGQLTIAVSLLALLYAVIEGASDGYSEPHIVLAFALSAASFIAFVAVERRSRAPMLRLDLFKTPAFAAAAAIGLLALFGFIGTAYALSIKLESVNHVSPLQAALPLALIQAVPLLLTPFLPKLLHHVHPRTLLVGGLLSLAAGELWMALLPGDATSLASMTGPILLMGVGFITMFSSLTAVAVGTVDIHYAGMASAVTSLVRETGQALGPAVMSAVALGTASGALADKLASSGLPPRALGVANAVNAEGGALAAANADLGSLSRTVAPLARQALESGLDLGMYICAGAALAGAVIAAVALRHSGAPGAMAIGTPDDEAAAATADSTITSSSAKALPSA
ncbi:MFS transporter [Streptomyces pseudovenezuelae]|uniref:MFS family permease n=1 Tax=Streptomyces pseudovenezuelae TaxID=67350 RepID=A0ABT6LUQ3_9ACTN|nr:MFS transporter [Streptomyces pseudovenezuelae]MDH6219610.1 MFS family permease [Streptomyces pseudovenezuelae]